MLRAIDGSLTGTGTAVLHGTNCLGGVLITADGTNAAIVTIKRADETGEVIFIVSTKQPMFCEFQKGLEIGNRAYYTVSGTGASIQLFEYIA